MPKRIAVDLDGTLCPEGPAHERPYQPFFVETRDLVNRAYDDGFDITVYSARHWNELRSTEDWLRANGVCFHRVVLGKFPFDFILDDRSGNKPEDLRRYLEGQ